MGIGVNGEDLAMKMMRDGRAIIALTGIEEGLGRRPGRDHVPEHHHEGDTKTVIAKTGIEAHGASASSARLVLARLEEGETTTAKTAKNRTQAHAAQAPQTLAPVRALRTVHLRSHMIGVTQIAINHTAIARMSASHTPRHQTIRKLKMIVPPS